MKMKHARGNQEMNQKIRAGLQASIDAGTDAPFDFQVGGPATFFWKEELKALGFRWVPYRCWYQTFSGTEAYAAVEGEIYKTLDAANGGLVAGIAKAGRTAEEA